MVDEALGADQELVQEPGPRVLLLTNRNVYPPRKGVVVLAAEETRRETLLVNKLLDASIWQREGICLVLGVPVDIQSVHMPLPLIVLRPMTGVVVPRGNVILPWVVDHLFSIQRQDTENPCSFGSILCVCQKAKHAVVAVPKLFAQQRRAGACCLFRSPDSAITNKKVWTIEAITRMLCSRTTKLVHLTRKP